MNGISGVLTNESLTTDVSSFSTASLNEIGGSGGASSQLEFFISKFKLKMVVYDYDRGFLSDDLIGYQFIDLKALKENM